MQPTNGRVFVETIKQQSGFELAGNSNEQYRVTAVGPDVTTCKVGDFVLFNDYREYDYNGTKIIKVNESDIDGCTTAPSVE